MNNFFQDPKPEPKPAFAPKARPEAEVRAGMRSEAAVAAANEPGWRERPAKPESDEQQLRRRLQELIEQSQGPTFVPAESEEAKAIREKLKEIEQAEQREEREAAEAEKAERERERSAREKAAAARAAEKA